MMRFVDGDLRGSVLDQQHARHVAGEPFVLHGDVQCFGQRRDIDRGSRYRVFPEQPGCAAFWFCGHGGAQLRRLSFSMTDDSPGSMSS